MSDMVLNNGGGDDDGELGDLEPRGRGYSLGLPSQTHKSTGKGRFAHRKHQKSKSLCTLETNLDELGEDGGDIAELRRVPSVHELRVTKSLQKLNVPDWFKQSSLSKSSSCLLKYGSNSTMNSFSFSPSLISSPCASTAPPAPNVVIRTRVVPPSNPRVLRTPNLSFSSSSSAANAAAKPPSTPVKLPSEKLREKEKNKSLMPIPIVPFAQIRAMFEKKASRKGTKEPAGEEGGQEGEPTTTRATVVETRETKGRVVEERSPVAVVVSKPAAAAATAVPSISISSEEETVRREQQQQQEAYKTASVKRTLFDKPPTSPTRKSPPTPIVEETFAITASSPVSAAQPQTVVVPAAAAPPLPPRPVSGHRATNGVSDVLGGHSLVSPSPRTENFPSSTGTTTSPARSQPVTEKPPISPTSAEQPRSPWRSGEAKDSPRKSAPASTAAATTAGAAKSPQKDAQPKSPSKDSSKQQFSPTRSLRQFFGRSKDKSSDSEKKSDGERPGSGSASLDSSFSSGDGVYEKEPRRLGVSEMSRRFQSPPADAAAAAASTSFDRSSSGDGGGRRDSRSNPDSSFSSEGRQYHSGGDSSFRSLDEGAPSRTSRAGGQPQPGAPFPPTGGAGGGGSSSSSRSGYPSNSERHHPPFSRFRPAEDGDTSGRAEQGREEVPSRFQHLPASDTSYGHVSSSSENGDHVPDQSVPSSSSSTGHSATAATGEKKSVKETTV